MEQKGTPCFDVGFWVLRNSTKQIAAETLNKWLQMLKLGASAYSKLRVEMPRETPEANLVKKT